MKKPTILAAFLLLSIIPASARSWRPQSPALAQDYSIIADNRPNRDLVELIWMTWPMNADSSPTLRQFLDRYVIIGVVHGHPNPGGTYVYDKSEDVQATDLDGTPLKELPVGSYPPMVVGAVATLSSVMRQTVGALGEGMKFMVFDSANVRACEKGRLSVHYAGETYTYETPIPGCPAN